MADLEQRVAELERIVADLQKRRERSEPGYAGAPPDLKTWSLKATLNPGDGPWDVYQGPPRPGSWTDLKVVAGNGRRVPNKANYFLCWNGSRFTLSRQTQLLEQHRPELYRAVVDLLKGTNQ